MITMTHENKYLFQMISISRFLIKDFSVSLTLYGGSDLATAQISPRKSYSVDEYNEGRGKGQQKVTNFTETWYWKKNEIKSEFFKFVHIFGRKI